MIKTDSWNTVTLLCGNHGEDFSHKMQLKEGPHSLFYSCPEYKSIYGTNHEGRSCNNRLTLVDFERCSIILMKNLMLRLTGSKLDRLYMDRKGSNIQSVRT